jgi:hypothetical protein
MLGVTAPGMAGESTPNDARDRALGVEGENAPNYLGYGARYGRGSAPSDDRDTALGMAGESALSYAGDRRWGPREGDPRIPLALKALGNRGNSASECFWG